MGLDLDETKGALEELSSQNFVVKKDCDGTNKRQSKLTDSMLRIKACDKHIKELESELAASGEEIV